MEGVENGKLHVFLFLLVEVLGRGSIVILGLRAILAARKTSKSEAEIEGIEFRFSVHIQHGTMCC